MLERNMVKDKVRLERHDLVLSEKFRLFLKRSEEWQLLREKFPKLTKQDTKSNEGSTYLPGGLLQKDIRP